ncbi:class I SAM-dependent methyltransferase [Vagococcus teuberi]|uniref:16S rRNA (Cytosine(1402)-N(4))-methyltransferase n=1 Tax=Vagococcus teuberi TaxID=519472 RepID=A0A1J0A3B1_9ENTE|nr:class I SAM-dependent methyltransferase [Vagococcus teuberi]APB30408.1 16S rRNA (cytosine(1402)-N(4))-methyltransferase [Vagococcus teuberi]
MLKTALHFSHQLLSDCVQPGDVVIDATMGNGHDTVFLSQLVENEGHVYAFDIQEKALESTRKKLEKQNIQNTSLIKDGHQNALTYLPDNTMIKAAIFNLGYLPRGDKQITTKSKTTLSAITSLLTILAEDGRLILVLYSGHDEGMSEKEEVLSFAETLSQDSYSVLTYQFINQKNNPPSVLCIEKKEAK